MTTDWIAADMGMTQLRLWAMCGRKRVEARVVERPPGSTDGFARLLAGATEDWPAVPVFACGLVGSQDGSMVAPATPVPCPAAPRLVAVSGQTPLHVVCGVTQASPADMMRGDETRIAGLLSLMPEFDGIACLPGPHTTWARISAGEICNFKTFMTGELFGLIADRSVLGRSVTAALPDMDAFRAAVTDAMARPERGYGGLLQMQAEVAMGGLDRAAARGRLSGTLIGWELAAAKPWWLGCDVTIVGDPALSVLYSGALAAQGVPAALMSAEDATLAGLGAARRRLSSAERPAPRTAP